jgi:hypothetical protein
MEISFGKDLEKAARGIHSTPGELKSRLVPRPLSSPTSASAHGSHKSIRSVLTTPPSSVSSKASAPCVRSPPCAAGGLKLRSKGYVAKAQECWSRWRRERLEAKAAEIKDRTAQNMSLSGKSPSVTQHSGVTEDDTVLEIRGVPPPRTPVQQKRAARGSLGAARVLYTPPTRRAKGARV